MIEPTETASCQANQLSNTLLAPGGEGDDFELPGETKEQKLRKQIEISMMLMALQSQQHFDNASRARQKEARREQ